MAKLRTHTTGGYSLVEVLIAITILLIALAGPLTIAAKGLQSAFFAREQTTALYLAQEGIEMVQALRNQRYIEEINSTNPDFQDIWATDWNVSSFGTCRAANNGCAFDRFDTLFGAVLVDCSNVSNCRLQLADPAVGPRYTLQGTQGESPYTRVITVDGRPGEEAVDVTVTVSWETSLFKGATREVVLRSTLYNYLHEFSAL